MKNRKGIFDIAVRYFLMVLASLPDLWIFYLIFTPLTVYASYFLLHFFVQSMIASNNTIFISGNIPVEIIEACVAGSAYYLLFILNFSTGGIKILRRMSFLFLTFASFFVVNVIRIFSMCLIYLENSSVFDSIHLFLWYVGSVALVVAIWFFWAWILKVDKIPFYSDIKFLVKLRKNSKKSKRH